MQINRPNTVKVFGVNAMQGDYLPVKFGTNVVVAKEDYANVANKNFEYGLESLEGDLQLKDLNTVFFYQGTLLKYLFQKGIPEFSTYEDYETGAVVQHGGNVWIATKDVKASTHEKVADPCDPCGCKTECENPVYPSKEAGWCKFITSCEYDAKIKELEAKDKALEKAINDLKGVEGFSVVPNAKTGAFELQLNLSDGSTIAIPMTKFGHIEQNKDGTLSIINADGTTLELPKYVAEQDLDQQKGFYFNAQSGKWEVDLRDLVKDGSGLEVDREGYVSVKPADFIDNNSLEILPTGKTGVSESWLEKILKPIKDYLRNQKDANAEALAKIIRDLEAAQKAYADEKAREAEVMARGNYAEIKAYKENLEKLKQQVRKHENDLGNQFAQLKALGLTDEEILALIQAGMNKTNPNYITRIDPVEGGVKVTYANGTTAFLGGNSVITDGKSITGNGKDKELAVQLSKRSDNKIQLVEDGLYIGEQTEQQDYYVSTSEGNDDNIGTREKPMRTLDATLNRIKPTFSGRIRIHLKENEVFDVIDEHYMEGILEFHTYGYVSDVQYPDSKRESRYYRGWSAANYPRPTIRFLTRAYPEELLVKRGYITAAKEVIVYGIKLESYDKVENDNPTYSGYFAGVFNSKEINLNGVILREATRGVKASTEGSGSYRRDVFLRADSLIFNSSKIANVFPILASNYTSSVKLINYPAGDNGTGHYDFEMLNGRTDWLVAAAKNLKSNSVVEVDKERKLTFGTSYTHDLFEINKDEEWNHWW